MKLKILIILILIYIYSACAFAKLPKLQKPNAYTILMKDGKHIFVMLTKKEKPLDQNEIDLRKKFKYSGLYKLTAPTIPIWTIDWYAYNVLLSNTGEFLVNLSDFAFKNINEELAILNFYKKGELLKGYKASDLVKDNSKIEFYSSGEIKERINENIYSIIVPKNINKIYFFNIKSGALIKTKNINNKLMFLMSAFCVIFIVAFLLYLIIYHKMNNSFLPP